MQILAVNAGSSSLKFKMYQMPEEQVLIYGYLEKIGQNANCKIIINGQTQEFQAQIANHDQAANFLIHILLTKQIIHSLDEIKAIGHRIVNGGGQNKPMLITKNNLQYLESLIDLAPLHMPAHLASIKAFQKHIPKVPQVALFDTAFHATMPKENFLYAIPYEWYQKYGVRKYGFHGLSCQYITQVMEKQFQHPVNLIICHIGNGASITLVENSQSKNNSMGFTANAGLIMGSRCGDIDYSILPYLQKTTGKTLEELNIILNNQSGLEAFVPGHSDNRDLEKAVAQNNEMAILANTMYINRIAEYIAKYYIKIPKIDALIFCGGVGENASQFRKQVLEQLGKLGFVLDEEINQKINKFSTPNYGIISKPNSVIPCYVIPTDEELMIARETYKLIK